jgi:hypothetical protein
MIDVGCGGVDALLEQARLALDQEAHVARADDLERGQAAALQVGHRRAADVDGEAQALVVEGQAQV